ncbi:MAG: hypothetical protein KKA65_02490 [Nanoarchaeota archaeon]|nr:hypothetical protein [Nanoarchaeota archaeon]MBU4352568.1 hypothetical protein [Nanoarchaeota archaeon]MBU4456345.1 hypothetical protein [Nanoarchaeota archaeon]MCG2719588.1 hypothetical protein [Nanoarchaeota archaeon]
MNIEDLKKQRMQELQNQRLQNQLHEQIAMQQQVAQLDKAAKLWMKPEALSRYGNLKMAHPEKALQVAVLIAQFVQQGKLQKAVDDEQLKELLIHLDERKEMNITRK